MHVYVNGIDEGVAARDIPRLVYAVVDMFGAVTQVSVTSKLPSLRTLHAKESAAPPSIHSLDSQYTLSEVCSSAHSTANTHSQRFVPQL